MKSYLKTIACLLVISVGCLFVAGCTTPTNPTAATTTKASQATTATTTTGSTAPQISVPFAETFAFSILSTIWSPYDAESTLISDIMRLTNSDIKMEWAPTQDFGTKVNTLLSSNTLPDIIMGVPDMISLIDQGAILPLDDYYNETVMPDVMAIINPEDYPYIRNVNDGHIYSLLYTFDFPPGRSWIMRQDWLDKVNLELPKTWNDWLTVWRAVRDQDANSDGNATNEIPIVGGAWQLAPAFGIVAGEVASGVGGQFCKMPDGGYSLIYEHPNYRSYLENMAMLYKEKLLDQEFTTRNYAECCKAMDANIGFITLSWAEQAKLSSVVLRQNIPAATVQCIVPVTGPAGDQYIMARNKFGNRGVVTVSAEKDDKVEKIMRFFNWLYTDDGARLMNYGVEGTHHALVNGTPVLKAPYIESFVNARKGGLIFQPFPFYWLQDNYMQILLQGKAYAELDDVTKIFYDGLFLNEPYFAYVPPTLVTQAYSQYSADLMPRMRELEANAIIGSITVDQFYTEYAALKGKGLADIIKQASEAWQMVNQ